ncbi:MAG: 4-hydroxy-tetrahydrodipicolinate reductase [Cytophagaceae bacterium]
MRILLLGYGKMGKTIEQIALSRNHSIPFKIDVENYKELQNVKSSDVDVAIEFTQPESAYANVKYCIENNIPVVCGTTGWLEKKKELDELCKQKGSAFFYASNFSLGVNLFFHLNKVLAKLMNQYPEYEIKMEEIHHIQKKDAPSGTAITLAEGIIENHNKKNKWVNQDSSDKGAIPIISKRMNTFPGTHIIYYNSPVDTIEITHTAHSREGFAKGAVVAAEWLVGKKGVFNMEDMLQLGN